MVTANNSIHSLPSIIKKYTSARYQIWRNEGDIVRKSPKYQSRFLVSFSFLLLILFLFFLHVILGLTGYRDTLQPLLLNLIWTPLAQIKQDIPRTLPLVNSNKTPTLYWQLSGPDTAQPLATGRVSSGRWRSKVAKRLRRAAVDGDDR